MLPSRTARRVAERRAAHQLLDTPVVLRDPLALRMAGVARPEAGSDGCREARQESGGVAAQRSDDYAAAHPEPEPELYR